MASVRSVLGGVLVLSSVLCAPGAGAAEQLVMAPGAIWQYSFAEPGAGWQTGADADVSWSMGPAPFSNCGTPGTDCEVGWDPDRLFFPGTVWPADATGTLGDDLWVRRQVDLGAFDLSAGPLRWSLGADNGYKLYVNGTLLSQDNAEGFTHRWEYTGSVPASLLQPGQNWFAVALEDHGGLTAFDMQLTLGPDVPPPVPEPAMPLLLGAGLAALSLRLRRR